MRITVAKLLPVRIGFLFIGAIMSIYLLGCDLVAVPNKQTGTGDTADHLVINEVFTLPDSQSDAYSWVELYNPTSQRIAGLHSWTLTYTVKMKTSGGTDSLLRFRSNLDDLFGQIPDTLNAGYFLVLAGDSVNLLDHINLGPAAGIMAQYYGIIDGSKGPVKVFPFFLLETDELVLRDGSGTPVDVVRYGNYMPESPDPYPGNHSAGIIPEWYSLCRYAYAYSTGNSANDFYMEKTPVPMWFSERAHP